MRPPLNLMAPDVRANPYPLYAQLRRGPVCQVEPGGMWAVSRYDDVVAVLKDTRRFSSVGLGRGFLPPWLARNPVASSLVMKDPPEHTRLRGLVSKAFSGPALQRLEAQVRTLAEELAEATVQQREVDFTAAFALPLPVRVLNLLFGLDPERWPDMRRWAEDLLSIPASQPTPERMEDIRRSIQEMEECFQVLIATRRARPGEDLVSELVRAESMTEDELMSFLFSLLPAGFETTAHLLSNTLLVLAQHPDELERVREDPRRIPLLIEEVLRYEPPAQSSLRLVTEDTDLGGVRIPRGALVAVLLGAALRDEQRFTEADRFHPGREAQAHLPFGHGIHFCLGAMLARMEARLGLEALFRRIRGVSLTRQEVQWSQSYIARGPLSLPLRWEPRVET
ncbi:Cytochrome P450 [Stigmatella aurantiaca]|uniref:Cytochrome P450 n=1 Tax=Stigmatella aurantiaca TaxID=41 RepID=A0A1H7WKP5_STIAU|nr:cytochrome P450 [Stigmatella aurantiaca]SEM22051.1 Cytochrome P450 [Stigmatella aurantiaca]